MKNIFIAVLLAVLINNVLAQQLDSIHFEQGQWSDILIKAKRNQSPIFVDCYTTWCGPCKWMNKNVFNNDSVADYYNDHFISYAVNMEKGDGIKIGKQFNVTSYPTFLFLNSDGKLLHRATGSMSASEFIKLAEFQNDSSKEILAPLFNYFSLKRQYDNGNRLSNFLYEYALARRKASIFDLNRFEFDSIAVEYFNTQSDEELLNKKNLDAICNLVHSIYDPMFAFLNQNKSEYVKRYGITKVDSIICSIAFESFATSASKIQFNNDTLIHDKAKLYLRLCQDTSIINAIPFFEELYQNAKQYHGYFKNK